MNLSGTICALALLCAAKFIAAQPPFHILCRSNSTRTVVIEQDWIIDRTDSTNVNGLVLLKWLRTADNDFATDGYWGASLILNAIHENLLPVYSDIACQTQIQYKDLIQYDTYYNRDHFDTIVRIIESHPEDFERIRIHQVLCFNKRRKTFYTRDGRAALLKKERNRDGDFTGKYVPLAWFKIGHTSKDIAKSKITWAVQTWSKSAPNIIGIDMLSAFKNTDALGFIQSWYWDADQNQLSVHIDAIMPMLVRR